MTEHTETRRYTLPTAEMTFGDLLNLVADLATAGVPSETRVRVTHCSGLFSPPESLVVEVPVDDLIDLGDDTQGRTGETITDPDDLATLPVGSVVVPMWCVLTTAGTGVPGSTKDPVKCGIEAFVRLTDGWYRASFDSRSFPITNDGSTSCRVVFDPRDEVPA